MGMNLSNNIADYLSVPDIASARFLGTVAWTCFVCWRAENWAVDERCLIGKWEDPTEQFMIRINEFGRMEVFKDDFKIINSGTGLSLNTWYLGVCACDGSSNFTYWTVDMDGTFHDDGLTATRVGEQGTTGDIEIGRRDAQDPMDGDIAYVGYIAGKEFSKADVSALLKNPVRVALKFKGDAGVTIPFLLPVQDGGLGADWGGEGNTFTVHGAPAIGDNPPVALPFGFDLGWEGASGEGPAPDVPQGRTKGFTKRRTATMLVAAQRDDPDGNPTEEYLLLRTDQFGRTRVTP